MATLIEEIEASAEVLAAYTDIKATRKTDWVNSFLKALANHPVILKRIWDNIKQVMAPRALDPLTKEFIYIAVSITNNCNFCIASHTASAHAKISLSMSPHETKHRPIRGFAPVG
jgi:AhpD family alkylhydroperoxidase